MNEEERLEASKQQILLYLGSQYPKWRLSSILTIQKILGNIYEFYSDLIHEINQPDDEHGKHTINKEIYTGLTIQAVSEAIQYIEELFAMLKFSQNLPYFIRSLFNYKAGKVTDFIRKFQIDKSSICKYFLIPNIPNESNWENQEVLETYINSINLIHRELTEIIKFFNKYEYLNNQYKHGLNIMFRSSGIPNDSPEPDDVQVDDGASIFIFDSLDTKKLINKPHRFNGSAAPLTNNVIQLHASSLHNEDNLLRFIIPMESVRMGEIVGIARKINKLYNCIRFNLASLCNFKESELYTCSFPVDSSDNLISMDFDIPNDSR